MKKHIQKRLAFLVLFLMILTSFTLTGCQNISDISDTPEPQTSSSSQTATSVPDSSPAKTTELTVHYIDVGQADCILVQNKGKNALIDAGNRADYSVIHDYLDSLGIKKLDTFILTHPHEDHIGSAAQIVQNFQIGTVYMTDASASPRVYKSLMEELQAKKIKPKYPKAGDRFSLGEAAFTFLGPVAVYDDLNSMSLVVRADFGTNSFLFTGDATDEAEHDMLKNKADLSADVLKVGHHGSRDSSTYVFLKAVNPKYSVISCGADNDYGHPHKEALSRLNDVGSTIFRTDQSGTVIASSNGKKITWNTAGTKSDKEHISDGNGLASDKDEIIYSDSKGYIGNRNSHVFHTHECSSLPKEENQVKFSARQKAVDAGYTPCGRCKP